MLMRMYRLTTPNDSFLASVFSLSRWGALLRESCKRLGLNIHLTPHSGRAGFATESWLNSDDFVTIRENMRSVADNSLRTYLDQVAAIQMQLQPQVQQYAQLASDLRNNFATMWPRW